MGGFIIFLAILASIFYLFAGFKSDKREKMKEKQLPSFKLLVEYKKEYESLLSNVKNGVISNFPLDLNELYPGISGEMNFVAIDFETFTTNPLSAVSLGIIGVQDGKVVLAKEFFFNNPISTQNDFFHLNKIYPEQVVDEPFFDQSWDEIRTILDGELVIIHNANFDLNVLQSLIDHYKLKKVSFRYFCTKNESRSVFQYAENYKLQTLAEEQQIPYWNHDALYDSFTASLLFFEIVKESCSNDGYYRLPKGDLFPISKRKNPIPPILTREVYSSQVYIQKDILQMPLDFYRGKSVIVTGTFPLLDRDWIEHHIEENGGYIRSKVTKKTFLLIHGNDPGPAKMNEIVSINRERQVLGKEPSLVVSERDFIEFLMVHGVVLRNHF